MDLKILKDWTINFIKNKDLIARKIINYEENKDSVIFHFKDKDVTYYINDVLNDSVFLVEKNIFVVFVCQANTQNLNFIISNWNRLKDIEKISFLFVRIRDSNKWIINPHVHNKICDNSTIQTGLKSMYSNAFGNS